MTLAAHLAHLRPPGHAEWLALPVLAVLQVTAEYLRVRFRHGRDIQALNLVEAVLAPLLFAFPTTVVIATVAVTQVLGAILKRLPMVKAVFNVAQWSLAAGLASALIAGLSVDSAGLTLRTAVVILLGLAAVTLVNSTAMVVVLGLAQGRSGLSAVRFSPVFGAGWGAGLAINALLGLLFVAAYAGHPGSVVLFAVPLVVLHVAYRGHAAARIDRTRLAGLRQAATTLATPLDPRDAITDYLGAVTMCFEARAASLVLRVDDGAEVHHFVAADDSRDSTGDAVTCRVEHVRAADLATRVEGVALDQPAPARAAAGHRGPLAVALDATPWRDCISAPLLDDGAVFGAVLVFDQAGIEAVTTMAELAVAETLARETASAFAKGELLGRVLEERRKLAEIVSTTSDGILTLSADGTVLTWNAALASITGLSADEVMRRPQALNALRLRTAEEQPVDLLRWREIELPTELRLDPVGGGTRRLTCSYSTTGSDGDGDTLVVVARDVTSVDEFEQLSEQFSRLVEAEAAQRLVVNHLQSAVTPPRPDVQGAELAVSYVPSESWAPTGGDLYDWHLLPSGELHVAVIDVLGHGVAATKDALAVVHALRLVTVDGTPLEDVIARTDTLLGAQNPDLVATVLVVRYDPRTGVARVATGGHPPALVVSGEGVVRQIPASGGAIGWPGAGSDAVATVSLAVDDTLVIYTDGLIEARKDLIEGLESLMRTAGEVAHLPADELAPYLVEASLAGAQRRDDTLALVLRRVVPAAHDLRMRWELPAQRSSVPTARRDLTEWLVGRGADADTRDRVEVVATELLSNAVKAARSSVVLDACLDGATVDVMVIDDGAGSPALLVDDVGLPDAGAEGGRGLFLVHALSDVVEVHTTTSGTTVRCTVVPRTRPGGAEPRPNTSSIST